MPRKKKISKVPSKRKNSKVQNIGIGGGGSNPGFPVNQGAPFTQSISTPNDTYDNLRWYFISNERQFLSELYVEISLVQTICKVPVEDALRGGVELKSKQLNEEQLQELTNSLDRDDDLNTIGQACVWNRLFGGGGILILTDQDPLEPLDLASIGPNDSLEFRAVDMWELFWDKQNTEGYDPTLQEYDFEYYNYYSQKVHKSRVMRLKGLTAPSFLRPRLRGWGFSVVEGLIRSLNQYLRATDVAYEVLDEFKLDIFKVKNLINTLLSPNGNQLVSQRIAQLNYTKNYQNAMVLDSEDDYAQKQLSFAGLGEWMEQIRMQVAADMRMPMIKLFGVAASGLNASDESGIEVYNSMVESEVRNKIKYDILRMCEIKCQKLFGFVPDDLSINFKPLRVLSAEQEENVKTQKFNRIIQAKQNGEISTQEFRDACNRGNLFDITFKTPEDDSDGYMQDIIEEGTNDPYDPKDIDDPGADRIDTRRSRATEVGGASKGAPIPSKEPDTLEDISKLTPRKIKATNSEENDMKFMANTAMYERKAYEADGGDRSIDSHRLPFFENPKDKNLFERAKEVSQQVFGQLNKKFQIWWYEKHGGKF